MPREVAMAAFDVIIPPLLFHPFNVFFIRTTVGMRVVAPISAVITAVVAAFAASTSTSADAGLEVLLLVGKVGLFSSVDRRSCCLALLILAFRCIAGLDSRIQVGRKHAVDGVAKAIFVCAPFLAVEGAEEGAVDPFVGPTFARFEVVIDLFDQLRIFVDVVGHQGIIIFVERS